MKFQRKVLSNGLRVLAIPMPSIESATVLVMVAAGSRYETKHNNGVSHFLEHMAFKGTDKRSSAIDISSLIDGMGGEFNAFTGKEATGYYIKTAKDNVETSLDVLSDMLLHSKLDPHEIDKERGVIIEEINMIEDDPAGKISDIYDELLYGDTPMGWDIAGLKSNIQTMEREDFLAYMGQLYSASNMTIVVAGGINAEKTFEQVEKYFGLMKTFKTNPYSQIKEHQEKPAVLIREKQTEQVHIALGVRTVPLNSNKRYPLSVLSAILGGGMSSRLFHEVREKRGLAYYVRSHAEEYEDVGTLVSTAGIDPKRVLQAVEVMIEEYGKVAHGKMELTDEEFTKAKEYMKGHFVLALENSKFVASFFANQELLEDKVETPEEVMAEIDAVTKEQVESVGKEFFVDDTLNLAVIGKFDDRQKLEKLLKL